MPRRTGKPPTGKARAMVDDLRGARMNTATDLVEGGVYETLNRALAEQPTASRGLAQESDAVALSPSRPFRRDMPIDALRWSRRGNRGWRSRADVDPPLSSPTDVAGTIAVEIADASDLLVTARKAVTCFAYFNKIWSIPLRASLSQALHAPQVLHTKSELPATP